MSNVNIDFHSLHLNENGNEDIRYSVIGQYSFDDDFHVVEFMEPIDEASVKCTIKYDDNEVHVIRDGEFSSEMHFYKSEKSFGLYEVMGYTIDLGIGLKNLIINLNNIILEYELIVNQTSTGTFKVNIKIDK